MIEDDYVFAIDKPKPPVRICEVPGCGKQLSMYNVKKVCHACDLDERRSQMVAEPQI